MVNGFGQGFSRSGRQLLPEEERLQRSGTSFDSPGAIQDPRIANPMSPDTLVENASALVFDLGRQIQRMSKLPNGSLAVREGSPIRQRLDEAADTYAQTLENAGGNPVIAERVKNNIIAKLPIVAPPKLLATNKRVLQPQLPDAQMNPQAPIEVAPAVQRPVKSAAQSSEVQLVNLVNERRKVNGLPPLDTAGITSLLGKGTKGGLSEKQNIEFRARRDQLISAITDIDRVQTLLALPGIQGGGIAKIKGALREGLRLGKEVTGADTGGIVAGAFKGLAAIADAVIGSETQDGLIDPATGKEFTTEPISEIKGITSRLKFFVARGLQGPGKLLKTSIDAADKMVNALKLLESEEGTVEAFRILRIGTVRALNDMNTRLKLPAFEPAQIQSVPPPGNIADDVPSGDELTNMSDTEFRALMSRLGISAQQ